MKLTPELISYLPYIPEGKSVGNFNGHIVRVTTNGTYIDDNRPFGSYASPYCLDAENFYLKSLEEIERKNNQFKNGGEINPTVLPLISEDCIVYNPVTGRVSNSEVLSKFDKIPSTLVQNFNGLSTFIGSPRIIARTGPTEDKPVYLKSIEEKCKSIKNTQISKGLIDFDNVPFVKPVVCIIRETEEESSEKLNALFRICGEIIAEEGLLTLKKSWGDYHF